MNVTPDQISSRGRSRRTGFLLGLDIVMFVLTCILESLSLTGLSLHEFLGFVLCPLVLLHVVLQWPWIITQFRRLRAPGAYRARVNYLLNVLLLILMAAVLFSGVLISNQVASVVGDTFGRNRVWNEIHGWLNFSLIVAVGLHLALNWDWIVAVFRRRAVVRPALEGTPAQNLMATSVRPAAVVRSLWRGLAVFAVAALAALAVYLAMAQMYPPRHVRERPQNERKVAAQVAGAPQPPPIRKGRAVSLSRGYQQLAVTLLVIIFVIAIARYLLRVHL